MSIFDTGRQYFQQAKRAWEALDEDCARKQDSDPQPTNEDSGDLLQPVKARITVIGERLSEKAQQEFVGAAWRHPARTYAARAVYESGKATTKKQPLTTAISIYSVFSGRSVLTTAAFSGVASWLENDPKAVERASYALTRNARRFSERGLEYVQAGRDSARSSFTRNENSVQEKESGNDAVSIDKEEQSQEVRTEYRTDTASDCRDQSRGAGCDHDVHRDRRRTKRNSGPGMGDGS